MKKEKKNKNNEEKNEVTQGESQRVPTMSKVRRRGTDSGGRG